MGVGEDELNAELGQCPAKLRGRTTPGELFLSRSPDRGWENALQPPANEDTLQVFECNARFGDPEAQALLVRLDSDLLDIVWAWVNGTLDQVDVRWSSRASVCVVVTG